MLYNPIEYRTLRKIAGELFGEDSFGRIFAGESAADIYENGTGFMAVIPAPGVKAEDVSIDFEDNVLTVSVKRKASPETFKDAKTLRTERSDLDYKRRFRLSDNVNAEKISAQVSDGLLSVFIPKAEKTEPKKIEVKVQ